MLAVKYRYFVPSYRIVVLARQVLANALAPETRTADQPSRSSHCRRSCVARHLRAGSVRSRCAEDPDLQLHTGQSRNQRQQCGPEEAGQTFGENLHRRIRSFRHPKLGVVRRPMGRQRVHRRPSSQGPCSLGKVEGSSGGGCQPC